MTEILITDTHFGIKQNSITWFKSQKAFIENQFIPLIKNISDDVRIIHLGDVFDNRSTISTIIAQNIINIFKDIRNLPNVKKFIIIGGNHDYYSPNTDEIDTISLILRDLDLTLVTKDIYIDGKNAYIPWYKWDPENLQKFIDINCIKNIYTHADIVTNPINIKNCNIFSGHMHTPLIKNNLYNLGSCYYLNFGDSTGARGIYVKKDDNIKFIENTTSIRFHRIYNDAVFNMNNIDTKHYIELYIDEENFYNPDYINILSKRAKEYKNLQIIPITNIHNTNNLNISYTNYDIVSVIKNLIPAELIDKFNIIEELKNHE